MDQAKYDDLVAKGFGPVVAAFVSGAKFEITEPVVMPNGSIKQTLLVEVPK